MIVTLENLEIKRADFYERSAEHILGRRHDRTMIECAQVVFHKTLPDGTIESATNHLVHVGDGKWQVGNTGLLKIYIHMTRNLSPRYIHTEIIFPPPPEPEKKKRRRRRRKNRKPQNQVVA